MIDPLRTFVSLVLERKMKDLGEVDLANGSRVEFGSSEHMSDLTERIADMTRFRNRHKRGSAARENYSRTINRLKTELARARRAAESRISETEHARKKKRSK